MITSLFKIVGLSLLSICPFQELVDSSSEFLSTNVSDIERSYSKNLFSSDIVNTITYENDTENTESYAVSNSFYRLKPLENIDISVITPNNYTDYTFYLEGSFQFYYCNYRISESVHGIAFTFRYDDVNNRLAFQRSFVSNLGVMKNDILVYDFSTYELLTDNSYIYEVFKVESINISQSSDNAFERLGFFYDYDNYEFSFLTNANLGIIRGCSTFVIPNDSYILTEGLNNQSVIVLGSAHLYKISQGLYYYLYNHTFYCNIAVVFYGVQGSSVMTESGQEVAINTNSVVVGALYLCNGMDDDHCDISDVDNDCVMVGYLQSFYTNDDKISLKNYYTFTYNKFIAIGDSTSDVETYNDVYDSSFKKVLNSLNITSSGISVDLINGGSSFNNNVLSNSFNLIATTIVGLAGFLDYQILPGISIGALVLIPFALTLLFFILKLFKR